MPDYLNPPVDQSAKFLPIPRNPSGRWYGPTITTTNSASTSAGTLNRMEYAPVLLEAGTLDRIGINHFGSATASEVCRLGIYKSSVLDPSKPGDLLLDAGTVDLSTSTGAKSITISQAVTRDLYWIAVVRQGPTNTATLVTLPIPGQGMQSNIAVPTDSSTLYNSNRSTYIQTPISGALPATASASTTGLTYAYASAVRYV